MKKLFLIIIAFLFFTSSAFAAMPVNPSYVSPTGSGSACTSGSPCALNYANTNAAAGDTVYIKAGTYSTGIAPTNSGTGVGNGRIIFSQSPSENKPLISGVSTGINLCNRSYIKIDGIQVQGSGAYSADLENYSHHNEITNCEFLNSAVFMLRDMCGNSPETWNCYPTHNWIHHNTFTNMQGGGSCTEGFDAIRIGQDVGGNSQINYNTIEDNIFAHSGHANIDSYGFHYMVIKNNITRNEPWWTANGINYNCGNGCYPNYTDNSFDNKWGHRNFQIGFARDSSRTYSIVEGNRLGYQSTNPENWGDSNLSIAGGGIIVRYNYSFGAMRMGMYFKYVNSSQNGGGGRDNRVYNNTIYRSGYGYDGGGECATRRHAMTFDNDASASAGNYIKNNIIYDSQDGDFGDSSGSICEPYCGFTQGNIVTNNWCTSSHSGCSAYGNPLFVNPDITTPASIATLPDLTLQSNSSAKDGGTYLTTANGAGSASTTLVVADALYFQDGTWGSDLARGVTFFADWIAIGTVVNVVQISSINYATNTITLASAMTWSNGTPIWLYKNSSGTQVLYGNAPDYGAAEYPGEDITPLLIITNLHIRN